MMSRLMNDTTPTPAFHAMRPPNLRLKGGGPGRVGSAALVWLLQRHSRCMEEDRAFLVR